MAPPPATEDYYLLLDVEQDATTQQITQSYRRLALKIHPDRNKKHDATEAFQKLGEAYETLMDDSLRRQYDCMYPFLRKTRPAQANAGAQGSKPADSAKPSSSRQAPQPNPPKQTPRPSPPPPAPEPKQLSEQEQIAALEKLKVEREARWQKSKLIFAGKMAKQAEVIEKLNERLQSLKDIRDAEKAAEAWEKGWVRSILSPLYKKKAEESEEEISRKERDKQERMMEENLKGRKLELEQAKLKQVQEDMEKARELVETSNKMNEKDIVRLKNVIAAKQEKLRQDRERITIAARLARENAEREAAERLRAAAAARRAREAEEVEARERKMYADLYKRENERAQQRQKEAEEHPRQAEQRRTFERLAHELASRQSACRHHGWWDKVEGRKACPDCGDVWTYLLECPSCDKQACPKCQHGIRTKLGPQKHYKGRTN